MKIDNQKLIELIAEKTELDAETADKQLSELVARVKETADKGKALEIKGFGLFFRSRSGKLEFKPSRELETEVNYKYAGMEPVEMKKPRDIADEFTGEAEKSKPEDEPEPEGQKASEGEETDWLDDIWKGEGEESRDADPGDEDISDEDPFGGLMLDDPEEPPQKEPDYSQLKKEKSEPSKRKTKNPINTLVTAFVTVLVIIVGILVVIEFGFLNILTGQDESDPTEVTQIEPKPQAPVEMDTEEADPPVTEEEEQEQDDLPESEEASVEQEEISEIETDEPSQTFGLHGQVMDIDERFFTIILHSMRNEDTARSIRENLVNEGYRALITTHEHVEMGTMWRVGIGQFETLQSAQQAAQELPQNYRDNHFIGIIQ